MHGLFIKYDLYAPSDLSRPLLQIGLFASNLGSFNLNLEQNFHLVLMVVVGDQHEPIKSIFKVIILLLFVNMVKGYLSLIGRVTLRKIDLFCQT